MRIVMIIVTITVMVLVEHFHCRSDPRLKEMLAKFNIYVENVGGGSVSLIIPSKLEEAPLYAKCRSGLDGWMDGYPLDCCDY